MFDKLLHDPRLTDAISSVLLGMVTVFGYVIKKKIEELKIQNEKNHSERNESIDSLKRSSLRNEYMNFYNSIEFTYREKYEKTREIIAEYKRLNGNHYISALDELLLKKAIQEDEEAIRGK